MYDETQQSATAANARRRTMPACGSAAMPAAWQSLWVFSLSRWRERGRGRGQPRVGTALATAAANAYAASAVSAPRLPPSASALLTACSDSCGANSWMKACA